MFTGLIQAVGTITQIRPQGGGFRIAIDISMLDEGPAIGASIAVNGTCLTVTDLDGSTAWFDAVSESVSRTTLLHQRPGMRVNLEPALRAGDPLDGHLVQGHVDATGTLRAVRQLPESRILEISLPGTIAPLVAEKGSIAIDGISLTVVQAKCEWFSVAVIPHTWSQTTLADRFIGDAVNLEADVLARYAARIASMSGGGLSETFLREHGFS